MTLQAKKLRTFATVFGQFWDFYGSLSSWDLDQRHTMMQCSTSLKSLLRGLVDFQDWYFFLDHPWTAREDRFSIFFADRSEKLLFCYLRFFGTRPSRAEKKRSQNDLTIQAPFWKHEWAKLVQRTFFDNGGSNRFLLFDPKRSKFTPKD